MCLKNQQPVSKNTPCSRCFDYLSTYMPIVIDNFIYGECDLCYCEWCDCYYECMEGVDLQ